MHFLKYLLTFIAPFILTLALLLLTQPLKKPAVSIVVYHENETQKALEQTIQSLLKQSVQDFEVYIVAQTHPRQSIKKTIDTDSRLHFKRILTHQNKAYIQKEFLASLRGKKKLFLGAEDILPPTFLSKHLKQDGFLIPSPIVMHLAFTFNDDYLTYQQVSLASILYSSLSDEEFNIYIVDRDISFESKKEMEHLKKIKNFNISYITTDTPLKKRITAPLSIASERLLLPEAKKELSKILYMDADTLVTSSLRYFWKTDITDFYAATPRSECFWWQDMFSQTSGVKNYFNSGVVLFNIKKWHEENLNEKMIKLTTELNSDFFFDQQLLNILFNDKKVISPMKYNLTGGCLTTEFNGDLDLKEANKNPVIIHYTLDKPLNSSNHKFYHLWKDIFDKVSKL